MASLEMTPVTPVIVTGGASGIGRGCAQALAAVGRPVAVWDVNGTAAHDAAAAITNEYGVDAMGTEIDLRATDNIAGAVDAARARFGSIGGLVHAAGVSG